MMCPVFISSCLCVGFDVSRYSTLRRGHVGVRTVISLEVIVVTMEIGYKSSLFF